MNKQQKAQKAQFEEAKKSAKKNPEIAKNESLNGAMSKTEYLETYDLEDPEVFSQQAEVLQKYERCITLITIAFEELKATSWEDFHKAMQKAHNESGHFKDYLRSKIELETTPS